MDYPLAIVIPAYKAKYFDSALQSLAGQTNKNFKVYVSDDSSPEDLRSIAVKYSRDMDVAYFRFPDNMGRRNLVGHWNRSVKLTGEEWIWLFSDDDVMEPGCVQAFYTTLKQTAGMHNVYRFNIEMIDDTGEVIVAKEPYPVVQDAYDFLKDRFQSKTLSAAVEYIFRRDAFIANRGFVNFPAAYGSDDASWITFAGGQPIYTITPEKVYWRSSGINISSGKGFAFAKARALLDFIAFMFTRFSQKENELRTLAEPWFFENLGHIRGRLNVVQSAALARQYALLFDRSSVDAFKKIFAMQFRYTRFAGSFKKWSGY
jgi:glycosyltransferase involved in cell wall biosynthesis